MYQIIPKFLANLIQYLHMSIFLNFKNNLLNLIQIHQKIITKNNLYLIILYSINMPNLSKFLRNLIYNKMQLQFMYKNYFLNLKVLIIDNHLFDHIQMYHSSVNTK